MLKRKKHTMADDRIAEDMHSGEEHAGAAHEVDTEFPVEYYGRDDQHHAPSRPKPARKGLFRRIWFVITGEVLKDPQVKKAYPYMLMLALMAMVYIWNVMGIYGLYYNEGQLKKELKELRIRSNTYSWQKMHATKRDEIIRQVKLRGIPLREATAPDKVIEVGDGKEETEI